MAAFYLKYRPQSLDQLIGQEAVKENLLTSHSTGKLSHAYLFVGPRGTGKTSTARILAKMVNCESQGKEDTYPCNKCDACISITNGSSLDLIEIDAASNRGIDDIRSLRETIKLAPASSKKKVYIIDEVHMLTTEAFNALLKTLEEPPVHALFILATTDAQKVPATILSRVQKLDFKLAKSSDLLMTLRTVADGEKIKVDDGILKLLAKKADGSFRDGVKLLDQLSGAEEITKEMVENILQSGNFFETMELVNSLVNKDSAKALMVVIKQLESGINIRSFVLIIMDVFRSLVFIKNGLGLQLVKEEYGSDKYQVLTELAEKFTSNEVIKNLDILQEALEKLKIASIPSLPLELAVVEICEGSEKSEEQKLDVRSQKIDKEVRSSKLEEIPTSNIQLQDPPPNFQHPTSNSDISKLQEKWTFVLETIRQFNYSLEALLRSAKIADCSGTVVLLEVPYSFHQRILEQQKSRDVLESIFSEILVRPIKVSTVLGQRPQRVEDIANVEIAADDEIVSLASEIFNGKLVD